MHASGANLIAPISWAEKALDIRVRKIVTVRRIALTLNVFIVVSVVWGAIILPQQLVRGQILARELIRVVAAGTAVIAMTSCGRRRRPN